MNKPSTDTKTILIVEVDPHVSKLCQRVLTKKGFAVDIAISGMHAQEMLKAKEYNLLLINIKAPVINGIKLYANILENYPKLSERVVFTNGEIPGADTQTFLKTCGRPFLPKPFGANELITTIRKTLGETER